MSKKIEKIYRKKQGSALLSALFIMTLVAIAATAMTTRLQLDIYRTRLTISSDKLYLGSQAVIFWAMHTLAAKKEGSFALDKQKTLQRFPAKYSNIYPELKIDGQLIDLQAKLNVNLLQSKNYIPVFDRLFSYVLPAKPAAERKRLIQAIRHWVSSYQPQKGQVSFLGYYLKQHPAYLPGYQPMKSFSELRLVEGISAEDYLILQNYLTALPNTGSAVNLNTASKEVLMSLGNGLTENQANEIIQTRDSNSAKAMEKLIHELSLPSEQVTTNSSYFGALANVEQEDLSLRNYSIIQRSTNAKKKIELHLILEQLNGE